MKTETINERRQKLLSEIKKALYIIDMSNGFVNFGSMANPKYKALIPEQLKMLKKFREENELVNFILEWHDINASEFLHYPPHCKEGTEEASLIIQFIKEQNQNNTNSYYKNCINGMLNRTLQDDIRQMRNLREIVIEGVCADLCVMDFGRTLSRYLDEINHSATIFVVKNAIDTYDAPNHNREEWLQIAYKVLEQAGIILVEDINELEKKEKSLGLTLK